MELAARFADCVRVVWWFEVGFYYGAKHGHGVPAQVLSAVGAVLWWPSAPLLVLGRLASCARPATVYYLSQERHAVLAVTVRRDGWHRHTHLSSRPGHGRGRACAVDRAVSPGSRGQ